MVLVTKNKQGKIEFRTGNNVWDMTPGSVYFQANAFLSNVKENAGVNVGGVIGTVDGNAGVNFSGFVAGVDKNAGVNFGGVIGGVGGNAGVNFGGLVGFVFGNAGVNFCRVVGIVEGNAGVNFGGVYCQTGKLEDYTIGSILPKKLRESIRDRIPKWIKDLSLPALSFGIYNRTKQIRNSLALGLVNYIKETGEDYIALGALNIIRTEEGKLSYRPFCSGKITIDGILRHKSYEAQPKQASNQ